MYCVQTMCTSFTLLKTALFSKFPIYSYNFVITLFPILLTTFGETFITHFLTPYAFLEWKKYDFYLSSEMPFFFLVVSQVFISSSATTELLSMHVLSPPCSYSRSHKFGIFILCMRIL